MYLPRIIEEIVELAREHNEQLKPTAYELISAATGTTQVTTFLNNAVPGPYVACAIKASVPNTPKVQISTDGQALVVGTESDGSAVGIRSDVSLTSKGDILPAPIVVGQRLELRAVRAAGGATNDRFQLFGFHVSQALAARVRRLGMACWCVVGMPSTGVETPVTMDRWTTFDHLRRRDNITATKLMLRFQALQLWPLGLTASTTLPSSVDGGPGGDLGVTLGPGAKVALSAVAPSAALTLELAGRCHYQQGVTPP